MSSVQSVNGFMIDLNRLGDLCRSKGILFFVDAIQSLGAVSMDVGECKADFLSADGHKWLLAPEGIGIFYCRGELASQINPNLIRWKSVEFNTIGIYALGAAVDLLLEVGVDNIQERIYQLGDLIIDEAEKRNFFLRTPKDRMERGGIISFSGSFDPKELAERLLEKKIVVNSRGGALRVAPHFYNTKEEILKLFETLDKILDT